MDKKEPSRKDQFIEYLEHSIDDNVGFYLEWEEWEQIKDGELFKARVNKITPSMLQDTLEFVINMFDEDLIYIGTVNDKTRYLARIKGWEMFDIEEW